MASLCRQLSDEGVNAREKREIRAWCDEAYSDMSDAHIQQLVREFRRADRGSRDR
jgi:hypothetical protein